MKKDKNINWALVAKYLNDEASLEEKDMMNRLIATDEVYREIIEIFRNKGIKQTNKNKMIEVNTDSAWDKLKKKIDHSASDTVDVQRTMPASGRQILPVIVRVAAIIIIAAGLSYGLYSVYVSSSGSLSDKLTLKAPNGQVIQSALPDGSLIHLKSAGKITYESKTSGIREVKLEGEAYFDVTHDPSRPFIIQAGKASITVLGTSFSVQSDEEKKQVNVYVESGSVLMADRLYPGNSVIIEPGFIGILNDNEINITKNQEANLLSWKTGCLVFRETELDDVIHDLNHTYGTNIVYGDANFANCLFTATFQNQPIDTVLQVLKTAFNLDIENTRSGIILSGEGCN